MAATGLALLNQALEAVDMENPFVFGNPVRGTSFVGRQRERQRLHRALQQGRSTLITGEPRMGKTSLLLAVKNDIEGFPESERSHVCYLDAYALTGWRVPQFWQAALESIRHLPSVRQAYDSAKREQFGTFLLERLFLQLEKEDRKLILILDEFDRILHEPGLSRAEFYGGLRSLASRYNSLVLIIAARQSTDTLNSSTQEYSRTGSPYFNFMEEITVSTFTDKDVEQLLAKASFSEKEQQYLADLSGGHPYILQVAANFWYELHAEQRDPAQYCEAVVWQAFHQVESILRNTWRLWSPYQQMAFTMAALEAMPGLLSQREFDVNRLLDDLPDVGPEQRQIIQRGFLREDATKRCGATPTSAMMTWFLAEELTRLLRPANPDIAAWLRAQQWEGYLRQSEREAIGKALAALKPLLQNGISTFVKAAVEAFIRM
jgi:hypothetical protein